MLRSMVQEFFISLFAAEDAGDILAPIRGAFPTIRAETMKEISSPFTKDGIRGPVFAMASYKAAGPDGFYASFYQQCWSIVGDSVFELAFNFFRTGSLPSVVNKILLVLIRKVNHPSTISQFRPISLCNVTFKIITKAMTTHLKKLLQEVVSLL